MMSIETLAAFSFVFAVRQQYVYLKEKAFYAGKKARLLNAFLVGLSLAGCVFWVGKNLVLN
ncbi:MAG: hypothetical protein AAB446_01200 [Patescibacteria group bacterium]